MLQTAKTLAKRGRPSKKVPEEPSSDESQDEDFGIICLQVMPKKLNRNN